MPVIKRFGSTSLRIYADDHRPPHFHIVGSDFEVLVQLSNLCVIAGNARKAQISEAMAWALVNQDFLKLQWLALNERD